MKWLMWLRENGDKLLLGSFAGIALIGSILVITMEWLALSHHIKEHLPAGILILLATFTLFFLFGYERRIEYMKYVVDECRKLVEQSKSGLAKHNRKLEELGIVEIYLGRGDFGQMDEYTALLHKASQDLFIVGVTLKDLTREQRPLLHGKATNGGCSVRLLMLTPLRWGNQQPVLDPVEPGNLKEHFTSSLSSIRELALNVVAKPNEGSAPRTGKGTGGLRATKKTTRNALEVRFYDQAPALSLAVADAKSEMGKMRVEFTPHNETFLGDYFRPMMDLIPRGNGLFEKFYMHYNGLWEKSTPYIRVSGAMIYRNNNLDNEISELLGLKKKWASDELLVDE